MNDRYHMSSSPSNQMFSKDPYESININLLETVKSPQYHSMNAPGFRSRTYFTRTFSLILATSILIVGTTMIANIVENGASIMRNSHNDADMTAVAAGNLGGRRTLSAGDELESDGDLSNNIDPEAMNDFHVSLLNNDLLLDDEDDEAAVLDDEVSLTTRKLAQQLEQQQKQKQQKQQEQDHEQAVVKNLYEEKITVRNEHPHCNSLSSCGTDMVTAALQTLLKSFSADPKDHQTLDYHSVDSQQRLLLNVINDEDEQDRADDLEEELDSSAIRFRRESSQHTSPASSSTQQLLLEERAINDMAKDVPSSTK